MDDYSHHSPSQHHMTQQDLQHHHQHHSFQSFQQHSNDIDTNAALSGLTSLSTLNKTLGIHDEYRPHDTLGSNKKDSREYVFDGESLKQMIEMFWAKERAKIENLNPYSDQMVKYEMPLARIKKIMRFDPMKTMISAETPIVFSKAIELIIGEITLRAWHNAECAKRRTIRNADLSAGIARTDVFDFLIDIVPRDPEIMESMQMDQVQHQEYRNVDASIEMGKDMVKQALSLYETVHEGEELEDVHDSEHHQIPEHHAAQPISQVEEGEELNLPELPTEAHDKEPEPKKENKPMNSGLSGLLNNRPMTGRNLQEELTKILGELPQGLPPLGNELLTEKLEDLPQEWLPALMLVLQSTLVNKDDNNDRHMMDHDQQLMDHEQQGDETEEE